MGRIHGVDTSWSSYTGNYSQREPEDAKTFEANWDRIFGRKDKQKPEEQDNASTQSNDNQGR